MSKPNGVKDGGALPVRRVPLPKAPPTQPPLRWQGPLVLLLLTFASTLLAGAFLAGEDPVDTGTFILGLYPLPVPTGFDPALLLTGLPFALAFVGVLLAHEMGHWFAARIHRVDASLPYFVPVPPYLSLVGTLGAFIRIRGEIRDRDTLLDVGASGPWAGLLVSLPLLAFGLAQSTVLPGRAAELTPFVVHFRGDEIWLGSGLLSHLFAGFFFGDAVGTAPILLHPLALAGWLGFFVTSLNLIPLGQLDGGHILWSLSRKMQCTSCPWVLAVLVVAGAWWWGWWVWAAILFAAHRGQLNHPRIIWTPGRVGPVRAAVGVASLALLALTFAPVPFTL